MALHNPGEHQHVDGRRPGAQKRPRAGIDRGARGQHVVDQHQPPARNGGAAFVRHLEGALHVGGAVGAIEADLLRRGADAFESVMCNRDTTDRRDAPARAAD